MAHANTLRGLVLVLALAAPLFPVAAWADTIVLDSGRLTLNLGTTLGSTTSQTLGASGPDFGLGAFGNFGFNGPGCASPLSPLCPPGAIAGTGAGGSGASGFLTYRGANYVLVETGLPGTAFVSWTAGGEGILMPPLGAPFSASVPFSIAIFANLTNLDFTRTSVFAIGQGVATFSFAPNTTFPQLGAWQYTSGIYDIKPIPEPATWLLVPTAVGLAWLARSRRTCQRAKRDERRTQ